jgi:hypothetical protein
VAARGAVTQAAAAIALAAAAARSSGPESASAGLRSSPEHGRAEPGRRQLAFQRAVEWVPPRWPDPAFPQQLHLDIRVSDADQAERELLALGATRVPGERETGFRVFTDPVGHPFCIVFGNPGTG